MANKRANRRPAPMGRTGRIQFQSRNDGLYRNSTTWPYGKKDRKTGTQKLIPGVKVNW